MAVSAVDQYVVVHYIAAVSAGDQYVVAYYIVAVSYPRQPSEMKLLN